MSKFLQAAQADWSTPELRVRSLNEKAPNEQGKYVLYWMISFRRTHWNYSFQRAVEWARDLGKPLVVLEALRCDYRWASDRLHYFVIQGMADNAAAVAGRPALYYPYLEHDPGDGSGLLEALSEHACLAVTDDFPCFFIPRMLRVAARKLTIRLEAVDSNGLLPMRATDKVFARAYDFRRFLQKSLPEHLQHFPQADPLDGVKLPELKELPTAITDRWPVADVHHLVQHPEQLSRFPIDHQVEIVASTPGGESSANEQLKIFLASKLDRYGGERNEPELDASSGFSPYLHFGHLSVHQVFAALTETLDWDLGKLSGKANGARSGWWGVSETAESFLDELVTWRELGLNMCSKQSDYARYSSLPNWAKATLAEHASDERDHLYSLAEFEQAKTHDELWNAAQRQLVLEGRIHNYLRMLWGKKILEWSPTPERALEAMIELNNKYGIDGRDPNSYSGIFWVLGRYDRAWGPERPVYGKIRYMSSENTARKVKVKRYIAKYSEEAVKQKPLF